MNTYKIDFMGIGEKILKGKTPADAARRHGYNPNLINNWEDISIAQACDQVMREGLGHEGREEVRRAFAIIYPKIHRGTKFILPVVLFLLVNILPAQSILVDPISGLSNVHGFVTDTEVCKDSVIEDTIKGIYEVVYVPVTLEEKWTCYSFIPDELNTLVRFKYLKYGNEEFIAYNFDDDSDWSLRRVLSIKYENEVLFVEEAGQWTQFNWVYDPVRKTLSLDSDGRTVWTAKIEKITEKW